MIQIGEKLKELRNKKRMTQRELAEQLNVTAQAVSRWENDEVEPSLDTLGQLASIFGVTMDELFGKSPAEPAEEPAAAAAQDAVPQRPTVVIPEVRYVETAQATALAVCEVCNKPITEAEDIVREDIVVYDESGKPRDVRVQCKSCAARNRVCKLKTEQIDELSKRNHMWVWGIIAFLAWVGFGILSMATDGTAVDLFISIGLGALTFCMIGCIMLDNNFAGEWFFEISGWGVKSFPAIVFTFDIDGIVFLIAVRFLFGIIACITSVAAFILAVLVGMLLGVFVYPYAVIKHYKEVANRESKIKELDEIACVKLPD